MRRFLIDTNVVSDQLAKRPNVHVTAWTRSVAVTDAYLSVVVIGEIAHGIAMAERRKHRKVDEIRAWLARIETEYAARILVVGRAIMRVWGRMMGDNDHHPMDTLLAATASVHDLVLVTRNVAHFKNRGVRLLNPFKPPA